MLSTKEIAFQLGFRSARSLQRLISREYHTTPSDIRGMYSECPPSLTPLLHEARLIRSDRISPSVYRLVFEVATETFRYEAGQSIAVVGKYERRNILRVYSIASGPETESGPPAFELCIKECSQGRLSSWLTHLPIGGGIVFCGPIGSFTLDHRADDTVVLVGTGVGIAPLRSMVQFLFRRPGNHAPTVWLFFGARYPEDLLYKDEFDALARQCPSFTFVPVLSAGAPQWKGATGYVQEHLSAVLETKSPISMYACGPTGLVQDLRSILARFGYAPDCLHSPCDSMGAAE